MVIRLFPQTGERNEGKMNALLRTPLASPRRVGGGQAAEAGNLVIALRAAGKWHSVDAKML